MPGPREGPFTFFLDECLDFDAIHDALIAAGKTAGITVVRHRDRFKPGTIDEAWLPVIGKEGIVPLTKDRNFLKHELERKAYEGSGVAAFVLRGKNLNGAEIAQAFVQALPRMIRYLEKHRRPFMAFVSNTGELKLVSDVGTYGAPPKEKKKESE